MNLLYAAPRLVFLSLPHYFSNFTLLRDLSFLLLRIYCTGARHVIQQIVHRCSALRRGDVHHAAEALLSGG